MANPNHKPACKCVACSPATRARGQAALKKAQQAKQAAGGKSDKAEKPAKTRRTRTKKAATTTKTTRAAENTTIVVNMPATETPKKPRRRANPKPAAQPAAKPAAEPRVRSVGLPQIESGRFLVIVAKTGGVSSVKAFPTKKAALEYAQSVDAKRVRVCEVTHSVG